MKYRIIVRFKFYDLYFEFNNVTDALYFAKQINESAVTNEDAIAKLRHMEFINEGREDDAKDDSGNCSTESTDEN